MVKTIKQYRIIDGRDGPELTEKLNAALRELDSKNPHVTFEGMIARIEYTETDEVPGLDSSGKRKGLELHCEDCPHFQPMRRQDGEIDRRAKQGYCPFSKFMGFTSRDTRVCDTFLDLMENGELKIVKAKNDDLSGGESKANS